MAKKKKKNRRKKEQRAYRPRHQLGMSSDQASALEEHYTTAMEALNNRQLDTAERHFLQVLKVREVPDALYGLGCVYVEQNRDEEAQVWFGKAIKRNPKNGIYWYSLGVASFNCADIGTAWRALQKAKKLCPEDDEEIYDSIGDMLDKLDQAFEIALEEHPGIDRDTYIEQEKRYQRGVALQENGQLEEGLAEFMAYLDVEPNFYRALGNAGVCLLGLERLDEAEQMLRLAVKANPNYQLAHHNLRMLKKRRKAGNKADTKIVTIDTGPDGSIDKDVAKQLGISKKRYRPKEKKQNNKQNPSFWQRMMSLFGF